MSSSLRWTEDELSRYQRRTAAAADQAEQIVAMCAPAKRPRMNRLEAAYALVLEARLGAGEILEYGFEDTRLRLADGAWFKPDFRVVLASGATEFHECKGFWREAARVRIKVAADKYPRYRFIAVTRARKKHGGGWQVEAFM